MKTLILNGNPTPANQTFENYLQQLKAELAKDNHECSMIPLREMKLHDCIGCYNCWLKTPGRCCFHDDQEIILKAMLAADFVIHASPIIMGFISALLKRVVDRSIPFGHPFLVLKEDRMQHVPRYSHFPHTCLLLEGGTASGDDAVAIIRSVYERSSRGLRFTFSSAQDVKEISHALNNL